MSLIVTFNWYLFKLIILLNPDFTFYDRLALSWVNKVTIGA